MMKKSLVAAVAVGWALSLCASAPASCWTAIDPGYFAGNCPVIVRGRIVEIEHAQLMGNQTRGHDTAKILVAEVLKNILVDEPVKPGKIIAVRMDSTRSRIHISTDLRYPAGTDAVWLIVLGTDGHYYINQHPVQRQPVEKIAGQEKRGAFQPAGLQGEERVARAGEKGKPARGPNETTKDEWINREKIRAAAEKKREAERRAFEKSILDLGRYLASSGRLEAPHFKKYAAAPEAVRRQLFNYAPKELDMPRDNVLALCSYVVEHEPSSNIRSAAVNWLDGTNVEQLRLLARLLADPSADVRLFATQALGFSKNPSAADSVAPMLADKDRHVRLTAVRALGFLGAKKYVPDIVKLHGRGSWKADELWYFAEALTPLGETDVCLKCVRAGSTSDNWNARCFSVRTLQKMAARVAVPVLMELLIPELKRSTAELQRANGGHVFGELCTALRKQTGETIGDDAVLWLRWWADNHARYWTWPPQRS
jgi:HEAT repeat protein